MRARVAQLAPSAPVLALDSVTLLSPVANPGKIVAAPVNYQKHLDEVRDNPALHNNTTGHTLTIHNAGVFLKATSSLVGAGQGVEIRMPDRRTDHEIELAFVIGREASRVPKERALEYVAGYAIGLDITIRGTEDRSFRKSPDSYSVLGPWLVTADEIPNPGALDLEIAVNGERRQQSNTRYLILGVAELVELASSMYTLHPGDVILTGTPEGVSPIEAWRPDRGHHPVDWDDAGGGARGRRRAGGGVGRHGGRGRGLRFAAWTPTETPYFIKPEVTPERREFYDRIGTKGAAPLWEVLTSIIPAKPSPTTVPVMWRYDDMRPLLLEAGRLLTPKEAERRVLILENPGARGQSRTTGSLYAGLQLILPGEVAHCHRHTQSAIRFVLESTGAYTAVNGERTTMHPGDFILTPSWTYHDHGNMSDTPTVWLDGLDIPMVSLFDTGFFEALSRRACSRTRFPTAIRRRASRPTCCRWTSCRRGRRRRSSTIPTRAAARRWRRWRATGRRTPATASRCAS